MLVLMALRARSLLLALPCVSARHAIIYNARLSENAKFLMCLPGGAMLGPLSCLTCGCLCNILQWDKLNARSFVRVYENSVQASYATTICCGVCVTDYTSTTFLDNLPQSMKQDTCCTPFHFCCCIECAGSVIALAPLALCNNCFCSCFRSFYPGLEDPQKFLNAMMSAREVFRQGARLPAGAMLTAPLVVRMQ